MRLQICFQPSCICCCMSLSKQRHPGPVSVPVLHSHPLPGLLLIPTGTAREPGAGGLAGLHMLGILRWCYEPSPHVMRKSIVPHLSAQIPLHTNLWISVWNFMIFTSLCLTKAPSDGNISSHCCQDQLAWTGDLLSTSLFGTFSLNLAFERIQRYHWAAITLC